MADILCCDVLPYSMIKAAVTHMSLNEPSLTTMAVPYCFNLAICIFLGKDTW